MTDIRSYLRKTGNIDENLLNRVLEQLAEIQPEVKGDISAKVQIKKGTEIIEINQTFQAVRHNDRLLLETGDFILTESDKYVYLEVNTSKRLLLETGDRLLLETGDFVLANT